MNGSMRLMVGVGLLGGMLLSIGCWGPTAEGRFPCGGGSTTEVCPPGWYCHADGLCRSAPEDGGIRDANGRDTR